jgi:hypothetical protein
VTTEAAGRSMIIHGRCVMAAMARICFANEIMCDIKILSNFPRLKPYFFREILRLRTRGFGSHTKA